MVCYLFPGRCPCFSRLFNDLDFLGKLSKSDDPRIIHNGSQFYFVYDILIAV